MRNAPPDRSPPARAGAAPGGAGPQAPERADALLRRLEWTALRRLDGLLQGNYRTLARGSGLDLADLREYQPEDDVRHIDWNVTARLQAPHVRVFTEEREMGACFVLDRSASVDFGSGVRTKRTVQTEFTGLVARLLTRHGNRVGALLGDDAGARWIPSRGGRAQVLHLLHALQQPQPAAARGGAAAGTRLGAWLDAAGRALKRRATVFVVSDFISPPGWERPLARLAERHDVVAVRLYDPLEQALPDIGLVTLRDAETGEQLLVDTHDRLFRQRFARIAAAREDALRTALGHAGVDAVELSTDDGLPEAVMRFAEQRRRRSRLRGAPSRVA